ncbi:MAG: SRPBCC domain-containing protein [Candidatus Limnocylindrales bacterium]|jgi:activator of HSP90 ATPase
MAYEFEVSAVLPASPQAIYDAWMSSEGHTAMTFAEATVDPRPGGAFTAWHGYITGRTVSLEPGRRIVQTWRTTEFSDSDPDSEIEVLLEPVKGGTRLTLHHRNVPDGQVGYERGGWQESYFDPMRDYFSGR